MSLSCIKGGRCWVEKSYFYLFSSSYKNLLLFLPEDLNVDEYNGLVFWNANKNEEGLSHS